MFNKIGKYFIMIIIIMIGIFAIKKVSSRYNIPFISNLSQEV